METEHYRIEKEGTPEKIVIGVRNTSDSPLKITDCYDDKIVAEIPPRALLELFSIERIPLKR